MYLLKGFGPKRLLSEFPDKGWKLGSVKTLLNKIRLTGTTNRQKGSGRPRLTRKAENVKDVEELVLSQEEKPKTHHSVRIIARETGILRSSVNRIIHRDLRLKCVKRRRAQLLSEANRIARLTRCKQLLKQYSEHAVDMIWFSDEMILRSSHHQIYKMTVCIRQSGQKKRNIAPSRLLRTRSTFAKLVMCSVAVSKMGVTDLIFVDPGAKVDGQYYREMLLLRQMLPAIKRVAGDTYVFQQDSAPAHRARETIFPDLWPPNSPDLNPVDYQFWESCSRESIRRRSRM